MSEQQESSAEAVGYSHLRHELRATMRRGDREQEVLLGGGSRWERLQSARSIIKWNRWASKDSKKQGDEFPEDAPRHLWQINWINVWKAEG